VISPRHESRQLTSASGPKLAHEPGRDDFPFPEARVIGLVAA
jgi:hypothetical protein